MPNSSRLRSGNSHTHTHMHVHTLMHSHTHAHAHTHSQVHTLVHVCAQSHPHAHTHMHTHTHALTRASTQICTRTHPHTYIHSHVHTPSHMHGHTCVHTPSHTHAYTHNHTYTCTHSSLSLLPRRPAAQQPVARHTSLDDHVCSAQAALPAPPAPSPPQHQTSLLPWPWHRAGCLPGALPHVKLRSAEATHPRHNTDSLWNLLWSPAWDKQQRASAEGHRAPRGRGMCGQAGLYWAPRTRGVHAPSTLARRAEACLSQKRLGHTETAVKSVACAPAVVLGCTLAGASKDGGGRVVRSRGHALRLCGPSPLWGALGHCWLCTNHTHGEFTTT